VALASLADLARQLRSAQVNLKNAQDTLAKAKTKTPNTEQDIATCLARLGAFQR
jgi:hypothetical protein